MTLVDKLSEFIALTGEEILRDGYNVQVYIEDLKLKAYILVGSLTALYVSLIYFVVFSAVDNGGMACYFPNSYISLRLCSSLSSDMGVSLPPSAGGC